MEGRAIMPVPTKPLPTEILALSCDDLRYVAIQRFLDVVFRAIAYQLFHNLSVLED